MSRHRRRDHRDLPRQSRSPAIWKRSASVPDQSRIRKNDGGRHADFVPPWNIPSYDDAMSQITNLNRFRKQKAREDARREADANATKFGRTKAQKATEKAEADRATKHLDGVKRDD